MVTYKELSVQILTKKRAAVTAPTKPPIQEKTADIFCTYLPYLRELTDLAKQRVARGESSQAPKGRLVAFCYTMNPVSVFIYEKGQMLLSDQISQSVKQTQDSAPMSLENIEQSLPSIQQEIYSLRLGFTAELMQLKERQKFLYLVNRASISSVEAHSLLFQVELRHLKSLIYIWVLSGEEYIPWMGQDQLRGRHAHLPTRKSSKFFTNYGNPFQCYLVHCSKMRGLCVGTPYQSCSKCICKSKYLGPLQRSMVQITSMVWMAIPTINMFSCPGRSIVRGGSSCLIVVTEDVIEVLQSVQDIILIKPSTIMVIMDIDTNPPVKVLYWVSDQYLRSCEEQKRSKL